jgi:hypothetical protein
MKKELKNRIVYRHRNPITNEVFYVGSGTNSRSFENSHYKRNESWLAMVEKFGEPIVEILARDLTKDESLDLEYLIIDTYGTIIDGDGVLVNIKRDRYETHWSTKKKLSQKLIGREFSEETRKKLSQQRIGVKNPMYGLEVSKEHRLKISLANTNPSKEVRERKRIGQINRHYSEDTLNSLLEDFSKMDKIVHGVTYKMLANKYNITPRMVSENWHRYKKNK